jgi:hypothetical protein
MNLIGAGGVSSKVIDFDRRLVLMFLARLDSIFTGRLFSAVFFVRLDRLKFSLSSTGLLFVIRTKHHEASLPQT